MTSGQTSNYGLNQWAEEDKVIRTEFNEDNAKIDAALPRIIAGNYTGTGTKSTIHYDIGGKPELLLLMTDNNQNAGYCLGLAIEGVCVYIQKSGGCRRMAGNYITFDDTGFSINHSSGGEPQYGFNAQGYRTYYWALC